MITKLSFSLILHTFPKCLSWVARRVLGDFAPPLTQLEGGGAHLGNAFGMPLCTLSIREAQTEFPLPQEHLHPKHPIRFPSRLIRIFLVIAFFFSFFSPLTTMLTSPLSPLLLGG